MPKPKQGRTMQFYLSSEELAEVQAVTQELGKGNKRGINENDICRLMVMQGIKGYRISQAKYGELKKQQDRIKADLEARKQWEKKHPLRAVLERFYSKVKVKHEQTNV